MQIIVQKFGGTSVQSEDSRKHIINHVLDALSKNVKLVVVVSALGRKPEPYATDSLLELVDYPANYNSKREIDLLMSCGETIASVVLSNELKKHKISSIAITGAQAGIITNDDYNQAKINQIDTSRIRKEFHTHDVIVVAGFQGKTEDGEITTIGRGGSDTTAAALGVSLQAKRVEIFTDVNGIMTADPKVVKEAKPLNTITYEEMSHLAYQGAKVIHPRAVEIAMQEAIPLRIRSTYETDGGTFVVDKHRFKQERKINQQLVTGIAHQSNLSQIKVHTKEEGHRLQAEVFKAMADAGISVDFINISSKEVIYTIPLHLTNRAVTILKGLGFYPEVVEKCAKVAVVGSGMTGIPGIASKIVQALTDEGIQILQSADSFITIWVLIHENSLIKAVNALHRAFELNKINYIRQDFLIER